MQVISLFPIGSFHYEGKLAMALLETPMHHLSCTNLGYDIP